MLAFFLIQSAYVNVYNAKGSNHKESFFLAVSNDGEKWLRYGEKAIIFDDSEEQNILINGDPQILKICISFDCRLFFFKSVRVRSRRRLFMID